MPKMSVENIAKIPKTGKSFVVVLKHKVDY